jgi:hypothetical protein
VLSTKDEDLMTFTLPDGRSLVKGVAWLAPYLADKNAWLKSVHKPMAAAKPGQSDELVKPDVMYWDNWPVRQPSLIFGALATGREDWLASWMTLDPDPQVEEIRRNFPIRQPILWVK